MAHNRLIRALALGLIGCGVVACGNASTSTATPSTQPTPNGETSRAADAALADASRALHTASSYHLSGTIANGITVDVVVAGPSVAGHVTAHGVTWEILVVGGVEYVRGAALWRATTAPAVAAKVGDQWVRASVSTGFYTTTLMVAIPTAIPDILFGPHDGLTNQGPYTVHTSNDATRLTNATDEYDVAAIGPPYPLRWRDLREMRGTGPFCGLTLDRFNATALPLAAPNTALPAPETSTTSPAAAPSPF